MPMNAAQLAAASDKLGKKIIDLASSVAEADNESDLAKVAALACTNVAVSMLVAAGKSAAGAADIVMTIARFAADEIIEAEPVLK